MTRARATLTRVLARSTRAVDARRAVIARAVITVTMRVVATRADAARVVGRRMTRRGLDARCGRARASTALARARAQEDGGEAEDGVGAMVSASGGMPYANVGNPTRAEYERALASAVAEERYEDAARARDLMESLSRDSIRGVTDANEAFYRAFRGADVKAMGDVWTRGAHAQCAHPGQGVVCGRADVMASWELIFAGVPREVGIDVKCVDVRAHATDSWGFVTCVERIGVGARLTAVNVFERGDDGVWRVVMHQAHAVRTIG